MNAMNNEPRPAMPAYDALAGTAMRSSPVIPSAVAGTIPFFRTEVINTGRYDERGQPVFVTREFMELHMAGDRKNNMHIRLPDNEAERIGLLTRKGHFESYKRWKATKANNDALLDGMPVDQWPQISREQAELFKFNKLYTVQLVAGASDAAISVMGPGAFELREFARKWTSEAVQKGSATMLSVELDRLQGELVERERRDKAKDEEMAKMKAQIAGLSSQMAQVQFAQPEAEKQSAPSAAPPKPQRVRVPAQAPAAPAERSNYTKAETVEAPSLPAGFGEKA